MNAKKLVNYFSRCRQEKMIKKIENEFYDTLLCNKPYTMGSVQSERYEKLSSMIHMSITQYYFEEDLLDYLLNLEVFILTQKNKADVFARRKLTSPSSIPFVEKDGILKTIVLRG